MNTTFCLGDLEPRGRIVLDGFFFRNLDQRLQDRFLKLVSEHAHALNDAASGLSALSGTAQPFATTRAMSRLLNNDAISLASLIEPPRMPYTLFWPIPRPL